MNMTNLLSPLLHYSAAAVDCNARPTFFGLEPWYQYLQMTSDGNGNCSVSNFTVLGANSGFLLVALAIVDDLLRVAGLVAIGFVITGGIMYVTSQGSPDQTSKAQSTIINALIGLVIAVLATGIVNYIGTKLGA